MDCMLKAKWGQKVGGLWCFNNTILHTDLYLQLQLLEILNRLIEHRRLVSLLENKTINQQNSHVIKMPKKEQTLLELGIRFCRAFIFSLILLLLLYNKTIKTSEEAENPTKKRIQSHKVSTFSDRLWTSAARLLFEPDRCGAGLAGSSSGTSSPSFENKPITV